MTPLSQPGARSSTLDRRRNWPILAFALVFASCIAFAYVWFNTDLGRSVSQPSTLNSQPRVWLTARTNLPGYTFISEPVSDAVEETVATRTGSDSIKRIYQVEIEADLDTEDTEAETLERMHYESQSRNR